MITQEDLRKRRLKLCVEAWPKCENGLYNPACCRFPKGCSPHGRMEAVLAGNLTEDDLEPKVWRLVMPDQIVSDIIAVARHVRSHCDRPYEESDRVLAYFGMEHEEIVEEVTVPEEALVVYTRFHGEITCDCGFKINAFDEFFDSQQTLLDHAKTHNATSITLIDNMY